MCSLENRLLSQKPRKHRFFLQYPLAHAVPCSFSQFFAVFFLKTPIFILFFSAIYIFHAYMKKKTPPEGGVGDFDV